MESKLDLTLELELQRIISLQRTAVKNEDINSPKIREGRIERAIQLITSNKFKIMEALNDDFGRKNKGEVLLTEIFSTVNTLKYSKKNTKKWMRRYPRQSLNPMNLFGSKTFVIYQPLGSIGNIVPWNFPINLCFGPLGSIFAAGNRVIIKPSEIAPVSGSLIQQLIAEFFDEDEAKVITGDSSVAEIFCRQHFDHLLFTGSSKNAIKVMRGAADNLVPLTLELGGKSPAIISKSANLEKSAMRILTGKILNAGQVCLSPDYVLIDKNSESEFIAKLISVISKLIPLAEYPNITAIINKAHKERLNNILKDAKDKGGKIVELLETKKQNGEQMAPTLILNATEDMIALKEEIFGPILPIVGYRKLQEAIDFVNRRPNPLGLYWFGKDKREEDVIIHRTKSGGVTVNDVIAHVAQDDAPFGGVGWSGMGAYHGREGFLNFSHAKTIHRQTNFEWPLSFIRPPYSRRFFSVFNRLTKPKN